MASDTKIGLLLGLVFIFVIAFIIKGLPSFSRASNNSELTTDMFSSPNNPPALAIWERDVINRTEEVEKGLFENTAMEDDVEDVVLGDPNIRSVTPLSDIPVVIDEESPPTDIEVEQDVNSVLVESVIVEQTNVDKPVVDKTVVEVTEVEKPKPKESEWPKIHTVATDENLGTIAKKYYGSEEGNKRANVNRIFDANRRFLKSPDEIYVGQKLIIPALPGSAGAKDKVEDMLSKEAFKRVESIGKKLAEADRPKKEPNKLYIVREGDNLWSIAAEKLGDSSRYGEIAKLNADIIEDEHSLPVGLSLKLPVQ